MSQDYKVRTIDVKELLKRETRNYMLYFNYDNEAFMNTGIQESGSTPFGASTTTGPSGQAVPGKIGVKQDIIDGFAFLGMKSAFLATVSTAYPEDFIGKVVEALKTPGAAFIQALTSCDRGWRHPVNITAKVNKLAVDSGFWPLYSIRVKDGKPTYALNRKIKFEQTKELLVEYLSLMGRYRHLVKPRREDLIDELVAMVHARANNVVRLVDSFGDPEGQLEMYKIKRTELPSQEIIAPGHGLCQGCGAGIALNQMAIGIQMVAGKNVIFTNNTSCSEVSLSKDDVPSYNTPWMHHLFETSSTIGDAIATAYRIMQTKGHFKGEIPYVVAIGGDGSTYDIGFQFLKSALVRTGSFGLMNPLLSD